MQVQFLFHSLAISFSLLFQLEIPLQFQFQLQFRLQFFVRDGLRSHSWPLIIYVHTNVSLKVNFDKFSVYSVSVPLWAGGSKLYFLVHNQALCDKC